MAVRGEETLGLGGDFAQQKLQEQEQKEIREQIEGVRKEVKELGNKITKVDRTFCELYPQLCTKLEQTVKPKEVVPAGYIKDHGEMLRTLINCPECNNAEIARQLLEGVPEEQLKESAQKHPEMLQKFNMVCRDGKCKVILRELERKKEKKLL